VNARSGAVLMAALAGAAVLGAAACGSRPAPKETLLHPLPSRAEDSGAAARRGGVTGEIRDLIENGSSPSLLRALELIKSKDALNTEFGRVMVMVDVTLMRKVYPGIRAEFPPLDPPQTHSYTKILKEAERGVYTPPPPSSGDYLEHALPFLALYPGAAPEALAAAREDLEKAWSLNREAVLAPYFLGFISERAGSDEEALDWYAKAYQVSADCYPASLGLARIMEAKGRMRDAQALLSDLSIRYPDNREIKRQLALNYYHSKDWSRAEGAIDEILQGDPRDKEFLLMRAHALVERGQFLQAQTPLDQYHALDPGNNDNRLYLFLRARVQAEGYRNRDAALTYVRSLLRSSEEDDDAAVYAARLLIESARPEDEAEGRSLLKRLLASPSPSLGVISLALEEAVRREAWKEALPYLQTVMDERRSDEDLLAAYQVQRGLGKNAAALAAARELYERAPSSDDGATAYIAALIDTGRTSEAAKMIETRLQSAPSGTVKSRYYYLRSRVRTGEEAVTQDLRSSLFEDSRNLAALIAMFEMYHRRRDERHAVFYLKQALALAPDNPLLKHYQTEYAAALGAAH